MFVQLNGTVTIAGTVNKFDQSNWTKVVNDMRIDLVESIFSRVFLNFSKTGQSKINTPINIALNNRKFLLDAYKCIPILGFYSEGEEEHLRSIPVTDLNSVTNSREQKALLAPEHPQPAEP